MIRRSLIIPCRVLHSSHPSPRFSPLPFRIRQQLPLQPPTAKFLSSATNENPEKSSSTSSADSEADSAAISQEAEDPTKKELEANQREIIDLKDKYLRSVADFRNLQDRTKRDVASARDFAISKFARDLLDSIDNLDRALSTVPESQLKPSEDNETPNKDLVNLYDGLRMTERILMQTLGKHGLERFDPAEKGEKFDPNIHEASFMAKVEDKEDGSVFSTVQKGFMLNGRVVRAAKVGVVKNS